LPDWFSGVAFYLLACVLLQAAQLHEQLPGGLDAYVASARKLLKDSAEVQQHEHGMFEHDVSILFLFLLNQSFMGIILFGLIFFAHTL
jgi:hypothetical protein